MRALMRIVTGLALVAGFTAAASAQTVGLKAGWVHPTFGGKDAENPDALNTVGGGLFAAMPITSMFGVQLEALYLPKGAQDNVGEGITARFKIDYVEVPLLLRLNVPLENMSVKPYLHAGPYVAFKSRCKLEAEGSGGSISTNCSDQDVQIKSTDFGATFGGGVDFPLGQHLSALLEARYDLGLAKIEDSTSASDVKNRALMVFAGLSMPLGTGARGATQRTH